MTCGGYHQTGVCDYGCDGGDCPGWLVFAPLVAETDEIIAEILVEEALVKWATGDAYPTERDSAVILWFFGLGRMPEGV
jgi:hypothetical protein